MTTKSNHSERLLKAVRSELRKRKCSIYRLAKDLGVQYATIYTTLNPDKKTYIRKGAAKFSYEMGKRIENWLNAKS